MMWRLKFFLDFEKEEKWLEEMAWKGYQLESTTFGYTFRYTEPEDATIKIDHRVFSRKVTLLITVHYLKIVAGSI